MSSFRALQAQHETLISQAQAGEDIKEAVQKFIEDAKVSSSQISPANERDQLRANLRYWASYLYEQTGSYPNVDLAPASLAQRSNWTLPLVIGALLLLLVAAVGSFVNRNSAAATAPPAATESSEPTFPPATEPATEAPVTEEPALVEPTQGNVLSIQVTSVRDGNTVQPVTRLSGTYSGLPAGSSIHVLIQPLSKGGIRFPVESFASVAPNITSGEWSIEARFGQGEELKEKEDYLISVVAATSAEARQALVAAAESGLRELPEGVVLFPETVSVNRAAYSTAIDGFRLIYSSFLEEEGNFEIFSSNLDGSDLRRMTYTSGVSELFPSLSPDGMSIVYSGRRRDAEGKPSYSLEVINSDGTSPASLIDRQQDFIIERPVWSSDGEYVAYARGTLSSASQPTWGLALYEMANQENTVLIEGNSVGPRYIAWIPNSQELVFNSRIAGSSGFLKIDIATPTDQQLYFNDQGEELQPAISADGLFLAYMQLDNQIGNIYVVDLATLTIERLTQNEFAGSSPAWSPDGKTVFFQFYANGTYNIWSVSVEDPRPVQLTFGVQEAYPYAGYMYALVP